MTRFSRSNPGCGRNRRWTAPISTGRATAWLIEFAIRAFRRETPGRTRNSPSRITAAAITTRRLERKSLNLPHHVQRSPPPGLIEEVQHHMRQKSHPVRHPGLLVLIARRIERPVNEHGTPDYVLLRNEAPIPTVQAHAPVVAHGEIVSGRHDQIASL